MRALMTASLPRAPLEHYAMIEAAADFARSIAWIGVDCDGSNLDTITMRSPSTNHGSTAAFKPQTREHGALVVGYMPGICPAELNRQRELLEHAECNRIYRDVVAPDEQRWSGLLRALDILYGGDILIVSACTISELLDDHSLNVGHSRLGCSSSDLEETR